MKYHLFAHNHEQFVKVGDIVKAYETKIATIGTGNGQFYAHLHHSVAEDLSVESQLKYVIGWAKSQVQQYYRDPIAEGVDYVKMFGTKVDIGNAGYSWLQPLLAPQKGFHPGIDINGLGGGNTDVGMAFTSPIDGKVVYSYNGTGKNGGWGKLLIIEEIKQDTMKIPSKLKDEVAKYDKLLGTKTKLGDNLDEKDLMTIKELMSDMRDSREKIHEGNIQLAESLDTAKRDVDMAKQLLKDVNASNDALVGERNWLLEEKKLLEEASSEMRNDIVKLQEENKSLKSLIDKNAKDTSILDALSFAIKAILNR